MCYNVKWKGNSIILRSLLVITNSRHLSVWRNVLLNVLHCHMHCSGMILACSHTQSSNLQGSIGLLYELWLSLAVCLGSLSCWNVHPCFTFIMLMDDSRTCPGTFLHSFFVQLHELCQYCMLTNSPAMMFPPPNFTAGMVFMGRCAVITQSLILFSSLQQSPIVARRQNKNI